MHGDPRRCREHHQHQLGRRRRQQRPIWTRQGAAAAADAWWLEAVRREKQAEQHVKDDPEKSVQPPFGVVDCTARRHKCPSSRRSLER